MRQIHRLYAWLFGYFWLPCDKCGRDFGGHEMTAMIGPGQLATGKIWCPVCAHEDAHGHLNRSPIA